MIDWIYLINFRRLCFVCSLLWTFPQLLMKGFQFLNFFNLQLFVILYKNNAFPRKVSWTIVCFSDLCVFADLCLLLTCCVVLSGNCVFVFVFVCFADVCKPVVWFWVVIVLALILFGNDGWISNRSC